ncbi:hypothetical protein SEUCBS140593_009620 [Sporothrix eucalyptigena]|uniref:Uncharacterized protein n=1 Tax=Sporothrix eucalyptigena TaxID=1812306 RepID=A0ABP0CWA3_9PEZI
MRGVERRIGIPWSTRNITDPRLEPLTRSTVTEALCLPGVTQTILVMWFALGSTMTPANMDNPILLRRTFINGTGLPPLAKNTTTTTLMKAAESFRGLVRSIRHEISQAAYRGSERYYSPAPVAAGGRPMPRREYGETYHEPGYGAPHDPYANGPRYERGPGPVRTVNERAGAIPATGERRAVQTNPYDYDEYDPHNPTAEPSVKETTSAAASQRSQQQMQYQ